MTARNASPTDGEGSVDVGGRSLAYLQVGDPNGPLVLHNHGGPSSRLEARVFEAAAKALGLRFVCVDRPGQGRSDPQRNRTFAGWVADLQAVADALGATTFWHEVADGGHFIAVSHAAEILAIAARELGKT